MVALVTGAGRGIGLAIADRLGRDGFRLALVDRDHVSVTCVAEQLRANGVHTLAVTANVAEPSEVEAAVASAVAQFTRIDVVINNAGVDTHMPLSQWTPRAFDNVLNIDLRAALLVTQHAAPHLAASQAGCVVNISSIMANQSAPEYAAYSAAKAGLIGLTRGLAVELGPSGVRVNAICPGFIDTTIWDEVLSQRADGAEYARSVAMAHPLRRRGLPADIAGVTSFLVSKDAAFVSGTTINVDGALGACVWTPQMTAAAC